MFSPGLAFRTAILPQLAAIHSKALLKRLQKAKENSEKELSVPKISVWIPCGLKSNNCALDYGIPRKEGERQFGFNFLEEVKLRLEASASILFLSYPILSHFPTLSHHLHP
jgi:hypothetical protein